MTLEDKFEKLKLLVFDVDGILTDNTVLMGGDGAEYKEFFIADGLAFYMAKMAGLKLALVSGRYSPATDSRAKELGVDEVFQHSVDKAEIVARLIAKHNLTKEEVCFMGDDLVDLKVMKSVGAKITVPDAAPQIKKVADYVTKKNGGQGAVRELIDMILEAKGIDLESLWDGSDA